MTDLEVQTPSARSVALCRVLPTVPPMVGSAALMLVLFGWAGEWAGVLLLGWVLVGVALTSRPGERLVVWWYRGYLPTPAQWEVVDGPWRAALRSRDFDPSRFDLYMREGRNPNAYSLGKRSVIVTVGLLELTASGVLTPPMAEAVLVHELGHHATRAIKHGLFTGGLAAPWRIASRFVLGLVIGGKRHRSGQLAIVTILVLVLAVLQAIRNDRYETASVLCALVVLGFAAPLSDAATSRRCERLADEFAANAGVGDELAAALRIIQGADLRPRSLVDQLLARHPDGQNRRAALGAGGRGHCL
jgi:STE24 endopeptidase